MELISTALIKTITLHWERCSSSGVNNLKLSKSQANTKCTSYPSLTFQYCTLVLHPNGCTNLTGSQFFFYIRTIFKVEYVLKYMILF